MATLMMKGVFCLMASFLLIATTSIEEICGALRKLHFPLFQFSLGRLYLGIAGIRLLFHFGFHVDKLLFHFEQLVFLNYFGFFFGLFQNRFLL